MSDLKKTLMFLGSAVLGMGLVAASGLVGREPTGDFRELGTPLFPNFTMPEQATAMEVAEFDPETGEPFPFQVALKDGRWVIPSHFNYPADAKDRLARTAAGLIDLTRDTYRGDRPEDHKTMGVLDPLNGSSSSPEGLGKRITLKDKSNQPLADLIIGKEVEGQADQHYVRLPGENAVYGVKLTNVDLSPRFTDWIETNLLKLSPAGVREVTFQKIRVDPKTGELGGEPIVARKLETAKLPPGAPAWKLEIDVPPGQEVNTTALDTLVSTLANISIIGVRPKPAKLADDLGAGERIRLDAAAQRSLLTLGFAIVDGVLVSKEGSVFVTCDDGVVYNLHFGTMTYARGRALSSGKQGDELKETLEKPQEGSAEAGDFVESRFLFAMVRHSPELVQKPAVKEKGELPDDVFAREKAEREAMDLRAAEEAKRAQTDYEKKLEDGRKRAKDLNERFAGWYYVVPGDSFRKIVLEPAALTRPIGAAPAALPPGRFPGGFPGGQPGGPPF